MCIAIADSLRQGLRLPDRADQTAFYRYVRPSDNIDAITEMLHEAYGALAKHGMRFVASHQDSETTRKRMSRGETIVAEDAGEIVGVVTLKHANQTHGSAFYERPDVAGFGQFAVRPSHQGRGIGATLLNLVERLAIERGVQQLALDTAENATDLVAMYEAKGYSFVEYVKWSDTNYRSVVLAKDLSSNVKEVLKSFLIRAATREDTETIVTVFIAARNTWTFLPPPNDLLGIRSFINGVIAHEEVWVAELNGRVVGFAGLSRDILEHLYVQPDLHGHGIGSALFEKVKEWRPEGFSFAVFQKNVSARQFYERRGCQVVKLTDGSGNQEREPDALYEWRGRKIAM